MDINSAVNQAFEPEPSIENSPSETEGQAQPQVEDKPTEVKEEEQPKAPEAEENEESFTVTNPEELPEELKSVYKSLQADYTRKRQSDSAKVKELEAKLKQLEEKGKPEPQEERFDPANPDDIARLARQTFNAEREAEWDRTANTELNNLDGRLNENSPEFDRFFDSFVRDGLDKSLSDYVEKNQTKIGFNVKDEYSRLKNEWDGYTGSLVKSKIDRQNKLLKEKEDKAKKLNPPSSNVEARPKAASSIDDAIAKAFEA